MNINIFFKVLVGVLAFYVLVVVLMYVFQRQLIFHPGSPSGGPARSGVPEMQAVQLRTADGLVLEAWYRPPKSTKLPTIIYFHGNAGNLAGRASSVHAYLDAGLGVLLVSYRGYENNPGVPTEEGLYNDGRAAMQFIQQQNTINQNKLVLVGESLGSGVAVQMAAEFPVAALVLQGGFTSIPDIALWHYAFVPVFRSLIKDHFDNLLKIRLINAPLLVLHGAADTTVPLTLALRLYNAARQPKQNLWYPDVGHNELMNRVPVDVINFLKEQAIIDE